MVKKSLLKLLTVIILLTSATTPVFADDYVPSPNRQEKQEMSIVGGTKIENGGTYIFVDREDKCVDKVVLTPYEYKDSIERQEAKEQLIEAYKQIEESEDLSDLCPEIKSIAHDAGANVDDLAVRYLFDISVYEHQVAENHFIDLHNNYIELEVEAETLDNYVCLMVYQDGEWKVVEGVIIDPNNPNVLFIPIITGSGAYAIVVANNHTYGIGCIIHWIILGLALITSIIIILMKNKEDNEKDRDLYYLTEEEKNKQDIAKLIKLIKILLLVIDVVVVLILYVFFSNCRLDIITLLINYVACLLAYLFSKKDRNEKKN